MAFYACTKDDQTVGEVWLSINQWLTGQWLTSPMIQWLCRMRFPVLGQDLSLSTLTHPKLSFSFCFMTKLRSCKRRLWETSKRTNRLSSKRWKILLRVSPFLPFLSPFLSFLPVFPWLWSFSFCITWQLFSRFPSLTSNCIWLCGIMLDDEFNNNTLFASAEPLSETNGWFLDKDIHL